MAVHITSQPLRRQRGGVTEAKLQDVRKAPQAKRRRRRSLPFALRQRGAQRLSPPMLKDSCCWRASSSPAVYGGKLSARWRSQRAPPLRWLGGAATRPDRCRDALWFHSLSLSLPGSIQTQPFPSCNSAANTVREEALAVN